MANPGLRETSPGLGPDCSQSHPENPGRCQHRQPAPPGPCRLHAPPVFPARSHSTDETLGPGASRTPGHAGSHRPHPGPVGQQSSRRARSAPHRRAPPAAGLHQARWVTSVRQGPRPEIRRPKPEGKPRSETRGGASTSRWLWTFRGPLGLRPSDFLRSSGFGSSGFAEPSAGFLSLMQPCPRGGGPLPTLPRHPGTASIGRHP
jgi:hypothetical protein